MCDLEEGNQLSVILISLYLSLRIQLSHLDVLVLIFPLSTVVSWLMNEINQRTEMLKSRVSAKYAGLC